jgi:hypothetical protein
MLGDVQKSGGTQARENSKFALGVPQGKGSATETFPGWILLPPTACVLLGMQMCSKQKDQEAINLVGTCWGVVWPFSQLGRLLSNCRWQELAQSRWSPLFSNGKIKCVMVMDSNPRPPCKYRDLEGCKARWKCRILSPGGDHTLFCQPAPEPGPTGSVCPAFPCRLSGTSPLVSRCLHVQTGVEPATKTDKAKD